MKDTAILIGNTPQQINTKEVSGAYVELAGEPFYRISHYDQMRPFFMTIVSDSDHWLFISSNGSLTAGRRNPETALFPYTTDDKIHDATETTGSKTILLVRAEGKAYLWEPFSQRHQGLYPIHRHLYKNTLGNKILFEEANEALGLTFRYGWYNSEEYGFVRKASLKNTGGRKVQVEMLDGIQNLLPYGVDKNMQNERSTLVDAYKKNELLPETGIGLFLLSSIPVDKAEPSEALKATTVWSTGLPESRYLLSALQLDRFRQGGKIRQEEDIRAERGAYFINSTLNLAVGQSREWYIVAELNQGPSDVAALEKMLQEVGDLPGLLEADIAKGSRNLTRIVGSADGLQQANHPEASYRHFSNVLFNLMRGGVFVHNYGLEKADLLRFIQNTNKALFKEYRSFFDTLPDRIAYPELLSKAAATGQPHLQRLCAEYLPLTFSRRHGDPSRPWNRFSIEIKEEDGSQKLYYQGNWRDIFQNWEALALSYPGFIESMIAKFVNASTPDGYNPYRITRDGIDWEVIEPDDPWSYIGYWGDHQIIYLLKLLELSQKHHPQALSGMLYQPRFSYANVPYRIRPYDALLKDPYDTVDFDDHLEAVIQGRVQQVGADGKLVPDGEGQAYLANLTEKLLVSVLSKFSNFIPEGGIWLNTQRPEWNDANNALVGHGVSMVTLYYIFRFQQFCRQLFSREDQPIALSEEVAELLQDITQALEQHQDRLNGPISDKDRKTILDALGQAGSRYRQRIYEEGFSGKKKQISPKSLLHFFDLSLHYAGHTIRANKRPDNLYHSYNLLKVKNEEEISVRHLYEMLEGQVAVLSSGFLSAQESIELLQALRNSSMYREDQHSYILYPDRQLPRFKEKNNIPEDVVKQSELIQKFIGAGNSQLVERDPFGRYHFNGSFNNARSVEKALQELSQSGYAELAQKDRQLLLSAFEQIFDHQSFTGRSGTFFGYEGLGCIYWHMVSKLLLAAQENHQWAIERGENAATVQQLARHYFDIREGIGFNKTPEEYGAFPSDPYSHTPGNAGAQQPGMTGQVKEDILSRFGELGVSVHNGCISFDPALLTRQEFLPSPTTFRYFDISGEEQQLKLPAGSLGFTYCQVPFVYHLSDAPEITLAYSDGKTKTIEGNAIGPEESAQIFARSGAITQVEVKLTPGLHGPLKLV
ncbi:MAG: hypothetical protein KDD19_21005 [Phaeodactylibacter sp.]|nr:hypothetical protein [Phaeodactylibacter sp.]MCB9051911.1 hypothetical protein [Lewinellaceae bacterium]